MANFASGISVALLARFSENLVQAAALLAPDAGEVVMVNTVDGLRLGFANGDIVHLRPSGNAPELRCYAEADTTLRAVQLCTDCLARLAGFNAASTAL